MRLVYDFDIRELPPATRAGPVHYIFVTRARTGLYANAAFGGCLEINLLTSLAAFHGGGGDDGFGEF